MRRSVFFVILVTLLFIPQAKPASAGVEVLCWKKSNSRCVPLDQKWKNYLSKPAFSENRPIFHARGREICRKSHTRFEVMDCLTANAMMLGWLSAGEDARSLKRTTEELREKWGWPREIVWRVKRKRKSR
jgi:hypothetical protein